MFPDTSIFIMKNITHTVDCGRNTAVLYDVKKDTVEMITHEQLLALPDILPPDSFLVIERAHMGVPRTRKSLAQPFTEQQLFTFYESCKKNHILLKLAAHGLAPRARQVARMAGIISDESADKVDDKDDAKALAYFYNNNDKLRESLQNPPKSFDKSARRKDVEYFKDQINLHLNVKRADDKTVTPLMQMILENREELYDSLSPDSIALLRLERGKKGVTKTSLDKGMSLIYSVGATVIDLEGNVLTRYDNKIPGWKFISQVLGDTPNHTKGGVARSDQWFHVFKKYVERSTGEKVPTGEKKKDKNGKLRDVMEYKPHDPDINFNRTFNMDIKGEIKPVKIKRGHFNAQEDAKFLELRNKFKKCRRELHSFFCTIAIKMGEGKYELCGNRNIVSFRESQATLFD